MWVCIPVILRGIIQGIPFQPTLERKYKKWNKQVHGIIENVCSNRNCGIYASLEGLLNAGITCSIDVNIFSKNAYDCISKKYKKCSSSITTLRGKREGWSNKR